MRSSIDVLSSWKPLVFKNGDPLPGYLSQPSLSIARFAVGLLALAGVIGYAASARAQTSDAVAEALFRDGKLYFQTQDYDRACPKLAQSYKIDPAGGTVLLLAICYEQQGKLASAWARYNDALALAKRDGREDRERRAREGLEAVEPKLSYIKLAFDPAAPMIADLTLMIDGTDLPAVADTRLPVDPGVHHLVIRAPEYEDWATEVQVRGPADTQEIVVPPLRKRIQNQVAPPMPTAAPAPAAAVAASSSTEKHATTNHAWVRASAYSLGAAGLATVAVGSYFGIRAIKLNHQADDLCPTTECRNGQLDAIAKVEDARSSARAANILIGAGSAAVLSSVVLWYVYRKDMPAVDAHADVVTRSLSIAWRHTF